MEVVTRECQTNLLLFLSRDVKVIEVGSGGGEDGAPLRGEDDGFFVTSSTRRCFENR